VLHLLPSGDAMAEHPREPEKRQTAKAPITDSPWLWFALFTAVGLAALLATGGKFGKRQASIENKYQARSAIASGTLEIQDDGSGEKRPVGTPNYSTPDNPVIPLWPLEILLGVIFVGSTTMLIRERFR
jgi:hypothetical protein